MDNEVDYYEWVWDLEVITLPNCSLGWFLLPAFRLLSSSERPSNGLKTEGARPGSGTQVSRLKKIK